MRTSCCAIFRCRRGKKASQQPTEEGGRLNLQYYLARSYRHWWSRRFRRRWGRWVVFAKRTVLLRSTPSRSQVAEFFPGRLAARSAESVPCLPRLSCRKNDLLRVWHWHCRVYRDSSSARSVFFPFAAKSLCTSHPSSYGLGSSTAPIVSADVKSARHRCATQHLSSPPLSIAPRGLDLVVTRKRFHRIWTRSCPFVRFYFSF